MARFSLNMPVAYSDPNMILMQLMQCDEGKINPVIWKEYEKIAHENDINVRVNNIDRFEFYDRAKSVYAVIATGDIYNLSYYVSTNKDEFYAESFAAYESGLPLPDYIVKMIKETSQ